MNALIKDELHSKLGFCSCKSLSLAWAITLAYNGTHTLQIRNAL